MLVSVVIYIVAVVKLDELTMPKRFWKEDPGRQKTDSAKLAYLTDDDLWELQKRMVFYWQALTIVATSLAAFSLMLMLLPLRPRGLSGNIIRETFLWAVSFLILLSIYFAILCSIVRTRKRSKDPGARWSSLVRPAD